jgi:tRNA-dihydrouridine synthase 1
MNPGKSKDLLAYSPMLHARLFAETAKFRSRHFQPTRSGLEHIPDFENPSQDIFLDGRSDIDRPLTVQFCANDPDTLLEAAKYVQPYCDAVDLNLGCPQGIAKAGHYGAFLQEDQDLIYRIINKLHQNLDIPVTAKIRILETNEKTLEYAKKVLEAGASILTVHGRHRDQKGQKTGLADWSVIRYLRDNLPPETVIFANGNILRHEDIARCLTATGADGVMSAEGNLHDPTIFGAHPPDNVDDREYFVGRNGRGGYRMDFILRKYLSIIYQYVLEVPEPERSPLFSLSDPRTEGDYVRRESPEPPPAKRQKRNRSEKKAEKWEKKEKSHDPNMTAMQPHLFRLLRPLLPVHTEVRDALSRSRSGDLEAYENVLKLTEAAVKQGLLDYETNPDKYEEPLEDMCGGDDPENVLPDYESSVRTVRLCKRPWFVCQPYVRPLPKESLEKGGWQLSDKQKKKLAKEINEVKSEAEISTKEAERPKLDVDDGLDREQVAASAMVCG